VPSQAAGPTATVVNQVGGQGWLMDGGRRAERIEALRTSLSLRRNPGGSDVSLAVIFARMVGVPGGL